MIFKKKIFCIKWVGAETLKEYEISIFARSRYKAIKILFKKYNVGKVLGVTEDYFNE